MRKNMFIRIFSLTLIALIIILSLLSNFRSLLAKRYTEDVYTQLTELSVNNAASINAKISDQFEMMRTLSTYLSDEDLYSEKVLSMLNTTVESYDFLRCAITFPNGSFITHDSKNSVNVSQDEFFIKGFQGISTVTGPMKAVADSSKTVILITVPIYKNNQIIATLTCTYETKYLNNIFQMTTFNGKGYSYIIDKSGAIISKPSLPNIVYDGSNILTFFHEQLETTYNEIITNIAQMKADTILVNIDNKEKYLSYQPLGINEWYIFSVASSEVFNGQLKSMLSTVYFLATLIIVILLLIVGIIWFYIYISQKKSQKELHKLAYYDSLTNCPNHNFFALEARRILDTMPGEYVYIVLNVNKFKIINDIFGFSQGDQLLRYISDIIKAEAGKDEIFARFGADNFHILSKYLSKEALEVKMLSVAQKICTYKFDKDIPHMLSVGFGAYCIEDKSLPISLMGDKACMALSKIKGIHSPTTYFYNNDITQQLMREQEIENMMEAALLNGEMQLYLQPKFSTKTSKVHGAEALARWFSNTHGLMMPDSFIPLFEKNGFIINLDMFMMETVCKKLQEWTDRQIHLLPISVNQSRACLYQPNYIEKLMQILNKYNISPSLIEIEVTERAFLEDEITSIQVIGQLHDFGFKVAMDDFGTGYSSLNMLQDVLVDILKIDKNFFKENINSERGKKIVTNIVAMANDLNIEVVAEGIETQEQLDFLKSIHCASVQGYYFSKPIPTELFENTYCK